MTRLVRRLGVLAGILFLLSIMDLAVSGYLEPKGKFRIIAGDALLVSGNLSTRIPSVGDLAFSPESPLISMEFLETDGTMWRGKLHVDRAIQPGEFFFKVHHKLEPLGQKASEYTLSVFGDRDAYEAASYSRCERYLGIAPWWLTVGSIPFLVLSLVVSYRLSADEETLLNKMGMATVFKVNRGKESNEISFGMGLREGLREGEVLELLDTNRQFVGEVKVKKAQQQHATADVDPSLRVEPNYIVARHS